MVDLALIAYSLIAAISTAIVIVLVTNRGAWMPIIGSLVSRVSYAWSDTVERGRAQKARRDRLYGYDPISSSDGADTSRAGASTGAGLVVPPQQHQVAPELVPTFDLLKAYLTDHTLTDDEAIELLALARRSSGDDLVSANKIRDIVGGNEGKVKAHVAAFRKPRLKPRSADRLDRPANGWS